MRKVFSLIVTMVVISSTVIGQADLSPGIKLLANENYGDATKFFEKIVASEPKNGLPIYYLGKIKYALEDYGGAKALFDKSVVTDKGCQLCLIGQSQSYLDLGMAIEADKILEGVIKKNKKSASMIASVGDAYLYSKKPNALKAIEYLKMSRDIDPKVGSTWAHLGEAYSLNNEAGNAMNALEMAVEKDKSNVEAYLKMAKIWRAGRNPDKALENLEKAVKLAPEYAPAYKDLYEMYMYAKKNDKVLPVLEKYVSLAGNDEQAKLRLVKFMCFQAKDYERSIKEALDLKKTSKDYTIDRWLAWSYAELERYQESYDASIRLFESINIDPAARKAYDSDYYYLAKAATGLGKTEEGLMSYEKLWKSDSTSRDEVLGNIAKKAFDAKDFGNAVLYYIKKDSFKKLGTTDQYYLGMSYYQSKNFLMAEETFYKITESVPTYSIAWLYKARSVERTDPDYETYPAIEDYRKYIEVASAELDKNKDKIIEAYMYIGYGLIKKDDQAGAKTAFESVLGLDPMHEKATEYVKLLSKQK